MSLIFCAKNNHPVSSVLVHLKKSCAFLHLRLGRYLAVENIIQDIILELLLQFLDGELSGKLVLKRHNGIFDSNAVHLCKRCCSLRHYQIHLNTHIEPDPDQILHFLAFLSPVLIVGQHFRIIVLKIFKKLQIFCLTRRRRIAGPVLVVESHRITDQLFQHVEDVPDHTV